MNSAREQQIQALVRAALERPPEQRASFVAELAGADDELCRSVQTRLSRQNATDVGARDEPAQTEEAAELPVGAELGHYRIDGVLGRGGMGVVYRATDARLGRSVAIKFLSAAVANAEVNRRFRQEAKTASSLNHPHIVTVHDVGEHEGRQYIVSELVDGGTLDDWALTAKRRTWRQSVELLIGVADALAAAHSAGVLHRDVKPGNILIGRNGYAKLADFGLAKLVESRMGGARGGSTPAHTTRAGVVVGTVAYMSPEQAAGHPVDARSDVFSFGIVLYELLAGRRPFDGANDLELLKAIAHATPKPLSDDIPEFLRMVVDKALEKDPADRYQSMQDLVVDLRRAARKTTSSQPGMSASDVRVVAGVVKRHPTLVTAAAAALVLAVAGGTYLALARLGPSSSSAGAPGPASQSYEITQLTTSGNAQTPAISPDGKYVAYAQLQPTATVPSSSLWIRQIATSSNAVVVPPQAGVGIFAPTVTSDGTYVDFLRGQFDAEARSPALWRVSFIGGTPRPLVDNVWSPVGWSPDGRRMAFVRVATADGRSSLVVADANGANERVLATREIPTYFLSLYLVGSPLVRPAWSPDGSAIALFEIDTRKSESHVVVFDVASGKETIRDPRGVGAGLAAGLAWLGPASLLLSEPAQGQQRIQLWRMSYPDGVVVPLTNDLSSYVGVDVDASRTSLVTSRRDIRASVWVGDAAGTQGTEVVPPTPFSSTLGRVVWAGERVAYDSEVGGHTSIAAIPARGGTPEEIVANGLAPSVTSGGETFVFMRSLERGIWKASGSSGQPVLLVGGDALLPIVTPDDRSVLFLSARGGRQSPWIVPIEGGEPTQITDAFAGADSVRISPDGRRIMFATSDEKNLLSLVVCDLPACANRRGFPLPTSGPLIGGSWTPDGRAVAYVDQQKTNIWARPLDGGAPYPLTHFAEDASGRAIASFAWSRDGARLAVLYLTTTNDVVLLRLKP